MVARRGNGRVGFRSRGLSHSDAGRALRQAFSKGLVAPIDPQIDELLVALAKMSPHDMGSC